MASETEIDLESGTTRSVVRVLRTHAFVAVLAVAVLVGGGLRLVHTNAATAAGSNGSGGDVAAATACAAP